MNTKLYTQFTSGEPLDYLRLAMQGAFDKVGLRIELECEDLAEYLRDLVDGSEIALEATKTEDDLLLVWMEGRLALASMYLSEAVLLTYTQTVYQPQRVCARLESFVSHRLAQAGRKVKAIQRTFAPDTDIPRYPPLWRLTADAPEFFKIPSHWAVSSIEALLHKEELYYVQNGELEKVASISGETPDGITGRSEAGGGFCVKREELMGCFDVGAELVEGALSPRKFLKMHVSAASHWRVTASCRLGGTVPQLPTVTVYQRRQGRLYGEQFTIIFKEMPSQKDFLDKYDERSVPGVLDQDLLRAYAVAHISENFVA